MPEFFPKNPFARWWHSAGFAARGVMYTYKTQPNFRIEMWCALIALCLSVWLGVGLPIVALCCGMVLALELINTALEALTDLVSPEFHPLAGVAKDAAAGAVLVASGAATIVGAVVLLPPLWMRLFG